MRKFATSWIVGTLAVTTWVVVAGCGPAVKSENKDKTAAKGDDAHDHPSEGPHHGSLVELGNEEYHAEVCHDEKTGKIAVYLLDGKAKSAVTSTDKELTINVVTGDKPAQFILPAAPQAGDAAGSTSRFESPDAKLDQALDAEGAKARLSVTIGGKNFTGEIKHDDHGHGDDHDHDAKSEKKDEKAAAKK